MFPVCHKPVTNNNVENIKHLIIFPNLNCFPNYPLLKEIHYKKDPLKPRLAFDLYVNCKSNLYREKYNK